MARKKSRNRIKQHAKQKAKHNARQKPKLPNVFEQLRLAAPSLAVLLMCTFFSIGCSTSDDATTDPEPNADIDDSDNSDGDGGDGGGGNGDGGDVDDDHHRRW